MHCIRFSWKRPAICFSEVCAECAVNELYSHIWNEMKLLSSKLINCILIANFPWRKKHSHEHIYSMFSIPKKASIWCAADDVHYLFQLLAFFFVSSSLLSIPLLCLCVCVVSVRIDSWNYAWMMCLWVYTCAKCVLNAAQAPAQWPKAFARIQFSYICILHGKSKCIFNSAQRFDSIYIFCSHWFFILLNIFRCGLLLMDSPTMAVIPIERFALF